MNNLAANAVPQPGNAMLPIPGTLQAAGPSSTPPSTQVHLQAAGPSSTTPSTQVHVDRHTFPSTHRPPDSVVSSEVGSDDEDPDVCTNHLLSSFSFKEAVPLLLTNFPHLAGSTTAVDDTERSLSGVALGYEATESERSSLKESTFITSAMDKALRAVRGQKSKDKGSVSADNVPKFPSALPCGSFLPLVKLPFGKDLVDKRKIPDGSLQASSEDLSLVQEGPKSDKRTVSLTDKSVSDFEECVRRSLETVSALDSFMAGFILSVRHPASPKGEFQIREEMDTECLGSFATASVALMKYLANNMVKLHTNLQFARKDALLVSSSHSKDVRASLRAAPPDPDGSFFGSCASSSIEHEAKLRRDLHFMHPPQPQQRQSRPSGGHSSKPSFGHFHRQPYSKVNVRPKQKSQSSRFRPYPSQDSQRGPSKGKGDKSSFHRSSRKGGHPQ